MATRGQRMLNLVLSSTINTENEINVASNSNEPDPNLQNQKSVRLEVETNNNIQQIEIVTPSTSLPTNEGDSRITKKSEKRSFPKRKTTRNVDNYRKLHRGDDSEESDTLFGDPSSDEYSPDDNDLDESDYEDSDNQPKKQKIQKKVVRQSENEVCTRQCDTDAIDDQVDVVQSGDGDLLMANENFINSEEPQIHTVKRKKKIFSPKLKVTKKRKRNPNEWKKIKRILNRERGESYINSKGDLKPAKSVFVGNLCPDKCRLKCSEVFTLEEREQIFSSFYKLDINAKNSLLFSSMQRSIPQRKRTGAVNHKTATFKYTVTVGGKQTTVCKRAFVKLYNIGTKKVELIQASIKSGLGAPAPDRRGKHKTRPNKTPDNVAAYIIQHISSFPAEESHYSRNKNIHKKYLPPLLSIPIMHKLYLEKCLADKVDEQFKVKECTYRFIFNNEFNLSFGHPQSDTCSTCDSGVANEEHVETYKLAFESQKADREEARNSSNTVYMTLDLQQTMPLPRLSTSKAFYLRQMWFYNLGLHIIAKDIDRTICCTWTENQAGKGSNEIVSSLLRAIEVETNFKEKDHLILWTDSCSGQNKNFLMVCINQYLVGKGYFKTIDHKFPEVGHSYLDSDRDFGRIEKRLRKHQNIYTPDQYREVIVSSNRKNMVIDMKDHFRDTEDLSKRMKIFNKKKDLLKEKVCFRDGIKWFRTESFGSYLFKETYDAHTPFKMVILHKQPRDDDPPSLPNDFVIPRIFRKFNSMTKEKIQNLKEQLCFVPDQHKWFYEQVLNEQDGNVE
ncbi:uncharacterized protein [Leptinotarsa decemlineata]|uniref:uncharacterized protein n=1 Tax=Leptinotarsa decemlineata TaxID=7539 RepID=UPI003D30660B